MSNVCRTFWEIINHNITIGAIIVGVVFWVNAGDKASNDAIIELRTRQEVMIKNIEEIENNHLQHIDTALMEIKTQIATLIANQKLLLERL